MTSYIQNKREDPNTKVLEFTLTKLDTCYAIALIRTILTDIETVGIVSEPNDKNQVTIINNTSKYHNEIIKHRLSSIPVHIEDINTFPYNDIELEINVENNTDTYMDITTEQFRLIDKNTGNYLDRDEREKIFPKNEYTQDYIMFIRLRPKLQDTDTNDRLHLKANFDLCKATNNSIYNVVSTCSYRFTPDKEKQIEEWGKIEKDLKKQKIEEIEDIKQNWFVHDSKRIYKKNSYDFKVESIGVFRNDYIVKTACKTIIQKLDKIKVDMDNNKLRIEKDDSNSFTYEVMLNGDNYTIGKIIEDVLYQEYFKKNLLKYISYKKSHPHVNYGILIIQFKDENTNHREKIMGYMEQAITVCKTIYTNIQSQI